LPHQSFAGNSGHMAEPLWLRSLDSEKWFGIQDSENVAAAHFVSKNCVR